MAYISLSGESRTLHGKLIANKIYQKTAYYKFLMLKTVQWNCNFYEIAHKSRHGFISLPSPLLFSKVIQYLFTIYSHPFMDQDTR